MPLSDTDFYSLQWSKLALKSLGKMDKHTAQRIVDWMDKNVDGTNNPYEHGKPLRANRVGQWRYRVGNYRVVCKIFDDQLIVYALTTGHRRDIYDKM